MLRRLCLLSLSLCAVLLGSACGGTKDFTFDAGAGPTPLVDAGPCDVYAQTNCPSDLKCTILPSGAPICGLKGTKGNYEACANDGGGDAECAPGTACVDLQFSGYLAGNHCYPFCELSRQPTDGGTTCQGARASCLAIVVSPDGGTLPEGFCDTRL
jgi:hypothetical protein